MQDTRWNNGAKPSPNNSNIPICLPTCLLDLIADIFAFAITIRPNHESISAGSLLTKISLYLLCVLKNKKSLSIR